MQDDQRALAEAGVDRRRQVRQPVRGKLHVQVADRPRGVPGLGRRRGLGGADPAQGGENAFRVGRDRAQHALAVLVEQPLRAGGADVAQAGQVGELPRPVGGVERQRPARLQLPPVARVGLPIAAHFGALAGAQVGDRADEREALAGLRVLDLQNRVSVVLGAEDHADHLDRAGVGGGIGVEEGGGVVHRAKLAAGEAARLVPPPGPIAPLGLTKWEDAAVRPNRGGGTGGTRMSEYAVKKIDEMEAVFGGGFKRARAELGVESFGMQIIDMPANYENYPDHDHAQDGQEEVYVTLGGGGEIEIAGERFPLDGDHIARVASGTMRKVWPGAGDPPARPRRQARRAYDAPDSQAGRARPDGELGPPFGSYPAQARTGTRG